MKILVYNFDFTDDFEIDPKTNKPKRVWSWTIIDSVTGRKCKNVKLPAYLDVNLDKKMSSDYIEDIDLLISSMDEVANDAGSFAERNYPFISKEDYEFLKEISREYRDQWKKFIQDKDNLGGGILPRLNHEYSDLYEKYKKNSDPAIREEMDKISENYRINREKLKEDKKLLELKYREDEQALLERCKNFSIHKKVKRHVMGLTEFTKFCGCDKAVKFW